VGTVPARGIGSGPDEDRNSLETVLGSAVAAAKRRLRIVTPYFLPNERLMADIATAALRGVEVDLVMPARSNHVVMDWAMRAHLGFFAVPGLRWHLTPKPFDHSKLTTVDGSWALVGSGNWDLRSLRLNFEFSAELYGEEAVAPIDALIDAKIAQARPGDMEGLARRPLAAKLRDAGARLMLPYL
jgi:cardiolipin synthase